MDILDIKSLSTIGRPLDWNFKTNRIITFVTLFVVAGGAAFRWVQGGAFLQGFAWGVGAGLSVFLAWALSRELDPDHDIAAFFGSGLALAGVLVWGPPGFLPVFWMLLMLRVINRTTGLPASLMDSLVLIALSVWLVLKVNWGFGLLTAAAIACDELLLPRKKRQPSFALLPVIGTVILLIVKPDVLGLPAGLFRPGGAAVLMSLFFLPVLVGVRSFQSRGDLTGEPLNLPRVIAAQFLGLITGIWMAFWNGFSGIHTLLPFWSAVLGATMFALFKILFPPAQNR
ncbi:MAG: hypothetical protein MUP70_16985 [Candidatus Aminicenantes bacterium]|nr:hypothetical protein [Candidatus Aminicenantes bacterium]